MLDVALYRTLSLLKFDLVSRAAVPPDGPAVHQPDAAATTRGLATIENYLRVPGEISNLSDTAVCASPCGQIRKSAERFSSAWNAMHMHSLALRPDDRDHQQTRRESHARHLPNHTLSRLGYASPDIDQASEQNRRRWQKDQQ